MNDILYELIDTSLLENILRFYNIKTFFFSISCSSILQTNILNRSFSYYIKMH